MAVTVTQLAAAIRAGDGVAAPTEPLLGILTRLEGVATATVQLLAPDAPIGIQDEAAIRYAGYLYDTPSAAAGDRYAAAWRNSGAAALVAAWVVRRVAGTTSEDSNGIPTPDNGDSGVSEARINQLIGLHSAVIAAHHSPGTVDDAAVRAIIAAALAPGNSRGDELARTSTLPTLATTNALNITFTVPAGAPAGVSGVGNTLRLPRGKPTDQTLGVWAVAVVDGSEIDEVLIPWGGGGLEEESDSPTTEFSYHGLNMVTQQADRYLDVVFAGKRGLFKTISLSGDGDTLPADTIVIFYLAVSGSITVTGDGNGGGGGNGVTETRVEALIQVHEDVEAAHHTPTVAPETWAQEGDSSLIPPGKVTNAAEGTFLAVEGSAIIGKDLGTIGGTTVPTATATQAQAVSGTTRLIWTVNRLRQAIVAALPTVSLGDAQAGTSSARRTWTAQRVRQAVTATINALIPAWARDTTTQIPANKLGNVPAGTMGDDAYEWATEGNDTLLVPTDKINFDPLQNQIDVIVDELAHNRGTITAVVPTPGAGMDSLRYTLPTNLDGEYDVSVRVKARVQVNEFANISGNLRLTVDGGIGLNLAIPERVHNYGHAHEGVLNFLRKGLEIGPGGNIIDFTADVSGSNPPDVHFIELENMTITDTSLVNAGNVDPFIADWAETANTDAIPDDKLGNVQIWARDSADEHETPNMLDLGRFAPADIAAIPNGGEQDFVYSGTVQRDTDGTLAYIGGGWSKPTASAVSVVRYHLDFDPATYSEADGNTTLTVPYPTGITREIARAAFKTGFVFTDSHETPAYPNQPLTEAAEGSLNDSGSTLRVDFLTDHIRLFMIGIVLTDANQRNGWQLRLTMVM